MFRFLVRAERSDMSNRLRLLADIEKRGLLWLFAFSE